MKRLALTLALLTGAVAVQAQVASPLPEGLAAEEDSAGFTQGRYAALDALPDWGGIWFVQRGSLGGPTQPQLKGEYLTMLEQWRAEVRAADGVEMRPRGNCSPPGLPRIMMLAQYPYEFLFTPGRVTINQEAWMQTRTVWTDGREHPHPNDLDPSYHGHSIGHWEGDTLVIDTVGISADLEIDDGARHSDQFHLVERIRLDPENPDVLVNEMQMTDPEAFAQPWLVTMRYGRDRHGSLIEFQCSENNRNPVDENGETQFL